jgi:hypothetical protein
VTLVGADASGGVEDVLSSIARKPTERALGDT